jgi:iron complex outermembrane receptor protein
VGGVPANRRPGYRNWFYWDATLGSYTRPKSSDCDLKYVFSRHGGAESFLRAYRNDRRHRVRLFGGVFGTQWEDVTPEIIEDAVQSAGSWRFEQVDGYQLQLARTLGRHALMTGWEWQDSRFRQHSLASGLSSYTERDHLFGFVQDKIALTERWALTPGARYDRYGEIVRTSNTGVVTTRPNTSQTTFTGHTSYESDLLGTLYGSWAQIFRPISNNDYNVEAPAVEPLFDGKGNSWTLGVRKVFGNTAFDINYALTDMSNAIGRYSVWDPDVVNNGSPTGFGNFVTRQVNATQKKKALNLGVDHRFNDNWAAKFSYAYVSEEFAAKNWENNPDDVNVNALINRFRPTNRYLADVSYRAGRWTASAWGEMLTGLRDEYFTADHFVVLGLSANYDLPDVLGGKGRVYVRVDNITNEAWENRAHPVYGKGTYPQPGRSFMLGYQHDF